MRILMILTFTLLPFLSMGQTLHVGANVGIQDNRGSISPYGSLRLKFDTKRLSFGAAFEASRFNDEYIYYPLNLTNGRNERQSLKYGYNSFMPNAFVNLKAPIMEGNVYFGVMLGYYFSQFLDRNNIQFVQVGQTYEPELKFKLENSVAIGAQIGTTLPITKKLGLNAEVAIRYAKVRNVGIRYLPFSLGISYQL